MFTWDTPDASGVSVDRGRAQEALRHALRDASPGTSGVLWSNLFTGSDYVRDSIVGQAERTYDGVIWAERAA